MQSWKSGTNWAAVAALAGVAGVVVAFLAYVMPNRSESLSAPHATPAQVVTTTPLPEPPAEPATTPPAPTTAEPPPADPLPAPTLSLPPLLPGGCEEALAVVTTYYRTAGSTRLSRDAAASQAYQGMSGASLQTDGGAVYTVTVALSSDFSNMRFILEGMESGDPAALQARIDSDAGTLRDVCRPG